MNTMLLCLLLVYPTTGTDTLPEIDSLQQSLIHFYELEALAQIEEYTTKEQLKWIKYLPSPNLGYTLGADKDGNLTNTLRPSIGFNFMNIYRVYNQQQTKNAKINSIILKNENTLNRELAKLNNQVEKLAIKKRQLQQATERLTFEKEIFELEKQIFKIKETEYHQKGQIDILPSQFLAIQKTYLNAQKSYNQKLYKIEELKYQIENMQLDILETAKYYPKAKLNINH